MSFHMQKKLLGLQRNQIFNQGIYLFIYFFERGGGGCKAIWRVVLTSEKTWLRPLTTESSWGYCVEPEAICH